MTCPGCHKERPFLSASPLGARCQGCIGEGIAPSLRTEARMMVALLLVSFLLLVAPLLFPLWIAGALVAILLWAPANRWPALGGVLLLVAIWALLVPAVAAPSDDFPFVQGSAQGGGFLLLAALLLVPYFLRPVRFVCYELLFRGRGFVAGALQAGAFIATALTFFLGALLLF